MPCLPLHPRPDAEPHPRPGDAHSRDILHHVLPARRWSAGKTDSFDPAATRAGAPQSPLPIPLPGGRLVLVDPAPAADYRALARFHYRSGRPATFARVVAVRFVEDGDRAGEECDDANAAADCTVAVRTVAVGVLSYPVACCRGRERAFGLRGASYADRLRFANAQVRTISRVIVHPTFRSLGLSVLIVRRLIDRCPTRYVEALACMGRAHPLFDRAGMTRFEPERDDEPVYYLLDRPAAVRSAPPHSGHTEPEARRS